jgi:hypothetical protein
MIHFGDYVKWLNHSGSSRYVPSEDRPKIGILVGVEAQWMISWRRSARDWQTSGST